MRVYTHSIEKANEVAKKTLDILEQRGLTPTPENYELWYVHFSGIHPEISRAIELLEEAHVAITDDKCQELYQRFLSEKSESDRVRKAGSQIQETIKDVNIVVSDMNVAAAEYTGTLEKAHSKLNASASKEDLEALLSEVAEDTKGMLSHNQNLEEKLLKSSEIVHELQRDLELARQEALTDALTNLANRKSFDEEIIQIANESEEEGETFCLLMMDIDHFKGFNDNYGHQVGDQVLRLVARTLKEGVKGRDVVARYGGEEFALILPNTTLVDGVKVANNLREAVANKEVVNRNSGEKLGRITMSGGVAEFALEEMIDKLIERADAALYTAKHNGRNQVAAAPGPAKQTKNTA